MYKMKSLFSPTKTYFPIHSFFLITLSSTPISQARKISIILKFYFFFILSLVFCKNCYLFNEGSPCARMGKISTLSLIFTWGVISPWELLCLSSFITQDVSIRAHYICNYMLNMFLFNPYTVSTLMIEISSVFFKIRVSSIDSSI